MKRMKYFYPLLLLLSCLPAGAQSLYEKYERFLTTPRTYVCYRADGKLKMTVLDPRFTKLASKAQRWVPVLPGTGPPRCSHSGFSVPTTK